MAPVDLRLRAWAAVTRRLSSVATRSDAEVIALQSRKIPEGGVTGSILGKAAPGRTTTPSAVSSAISSARSASSTNSPAPSNTPVPDPSGSRPASGANQVAVARNGVGSAA